MVNDEHWSPETQKTTFFRSLKEGITIKEQTRTVKSIYNKRIWEGNESFAFEN